MNGSSTKNAPSPARPAIVSNGAARTRKGNFPGLVARGAQLGGPQLGLGRESHNPPCRGPLAVALGALLHGGLG